MKFLELNNMDMFSTGNIMLNIAQVARDRGHDVLTASKYCKMSMDRQRNDSNHVYIGNRVGNTLHRYWAWMTDLQETGSYFSTKNFISKVSKFDPDVIHLHDILGWYLNIDVLFNYIAKNNIPVIWTFHDCWAFTGRCIYFDEARCDRWKTGCGNCPQRHYMPGTWWFDLSRQNFNRKKKVFTKVKDLTIVTPSQWLADLTAESFLKDYRITVINNGIDLNIFKPAKGPLYEQLKSDNRKIVLGVAGTWSKRKGLDTFIRLNEDLPQEYKVVLVGLSKDVLPPNCKIEVITRTHNQKELAQIYTAADVLANPTLEDNFPTVNLEALACGTPIITYRTGGSPESVTPETGIVVEQGDYESLKSAIMKVAEKKDIFTSGNCLRRAQLYNMHARFNDYVDLMEQVARK